MCSFMREEPTKCEIRAVHLYILQDIRVSAFRWDTQVKERGAGFCHIPVSGTKLAYYDKKTTRALTLRMSIMLSNTTWIRTDANALSF